MTIYDHQKDGAIGATIREVVFGVEDGMVSTLGAITGIAIGSQDHFTVILAGVVIIAVESVSMGIGSYLANRSARDVDERREYEEREEIRTFPEAETAELRDMFVRDGWPDALADEMAREASHNRELMFREMAYRELGQSLASKAAPVTNALYMFVSYIFGGLIPLAAYFVLTVSHAMPISIAVTLSGLFLLGVATTKYTKASWVKSGARILILGSIALAVGLMVGELAGTLR